MIIRWPILFLICTMETDCNWGSNLSMCIIHIICNINVQGRMNINIVKLFSFSWIYFSSSFPPGFMLFCILCTYMCTHFILFIIFAPLAIFAAGMHTIVVAYFSLLTILVAFVYPYAQYLSSFRQLYISIVLSLSRSLHRYNNIRCFPKPPTNNTLMSIIINLSNTFGQ